MHTKKKNKSNSRILYALPDETVDELIKCIEQKNRLDRDSGKKNKGKKK